MKTMSAILVPALLLAGCASSKPAAEKERVYLTDASKYTWTGHTVDEVIRVSRPIYRDMRLTHYNGNAFTANANNLFHWALIRDEVAADVEAARNARR